MRHLALSLLLFVGLAHADYYAERRAALMEELVYYAQLARDSGDGAFSDAVMATMATVERHEFVPSSEKRLAYENRPLPIGHGQTISQPYIVALMTDLIEPDAGDIVLEIGTGSAYQAAILAELVEHVYTIEIVAPLFQSASERLKRLGYDNVTTRLGDGYFGWEKHAPFDAIVVTAAASHVPPPLINQLRPGGRMVIPVGGRFMTQQLLLIEKTEQDEIITKQIAAVRFVPLTGEH
ncbi:MAG: protein-L-isoaspartate(D-aspartate) O-methyltransferase [Gammaproteobacteria bacterium]|nr:protein-L-isoaspartate(D-aspartate) O-methyltransferase [Gammaproteobacteria bacterium]MDH3372823.1 protein-L-isoaspartate(D-aspartate) O-methyltransferase [Gammaproteobacteria bacterium]MDH3407977.1 protein-L-isoaspartate(D-aspartate) O-methyltransferase [Gammaproteobacteria bacterium]MDH3551298.1 protein-L-isoaspartate(D-aspartate) O-methyltransferase [Gammaproteobacteria bacterium]